MKGTILAESTQRLKYVVTDWVTTSIAFFLFNIARFLIFSHSSLNTAFTIDHSVLVDYLSQSKLIYEQIIIPTLSLIVYWLSGYYSAPFGKSRLQELITTFFSSIFISALIYLALLTNDQLVHRSSNFGLILTLLSLTFGIVYIGRLSITQHAINKLKEDKWHFNTLIIGNSPASRLSADTLQHTKASLGYKVRGFITVPGETQVYDGAPIFGINEIENLCRRFEINQLVISLEKHDEKRILSLLSRLFELDIPIRIQPDTLSYMTSAIHLQDIYAEPLIDITRPSVSNSSLCIKRAADVVAASAALLLLSPIMAFVALRIKFNSPGPIIYSQERIGLHRRPFKIYKFRTMYSDAEANGPQLSTDNDPRITPVGKILRKYRIDELPQFWNVIKGDMSMVGPRPERSYYIQRIIEKAPYYALVHQVRPGITSWGMVKYGYASTVEEMVRRTRYDLIYLSNMSLAVDAKILLYTIRTVLRGSGK